SVPRSRRGSAGVRWGRLLLLPPEFEDEEGVEALGVVGAGGVVGMEEGVDDVAAEMAGGEGVGGGECVVQQRTERGAEPLADGQGEAHLAAGEDFARQVA